MKDDSVISYLIFRGNFKNCSYIRRAVFVKLYFFMFINFFNSHMASIYWVT